MVNVQASARRASSLVLEARREAEGAILISGQHTGKAQTCGKAKDTKERVRQAADMQWGSGFGGHSPVSGPGSGVGGQW